MLQLKARLVGPEDATILEQSPVSIACVNALIECLRPNESYLEITVHEVEPSVNH